VKIYRQGEEKTLTVAVGEMQNEKTAAAGRPQAAPETGKVGLAVQDLTADQKEQLEVKGGVVVGGRSGSGGQGRNSRRRRRPRGKRRDGAVGQAVQATGR